MTTTDLCNYYWSSNNALCYSKFRAELIKREKKVGPAEECGNPTSICNLNITGMKSEQLCAAYWNETASECERDIRGELSDRKQKSTPKESCGQPVFLADKQQKATTNTLPPQATPVTPVNTERLSIGASKKKCEDLGFKPATEAFGKCVLQLSR